MPSENDWGAGRQWISRANPYAKCRVTLSNPRSRHSSKVLWDNRFWGDSVTSWDILMKGKWLMSSLARPVLGLINGIPLSPTPPKEAPIITCHLNNILMPAPDSLRFYGNLNQTQVWNTSNNEHENAKKFGFTSATEELEMFHEELRGFPNSLGVF